ncbi:MAG: nucleotidyltransferase, partial [Rhodobacteraceae bacterium]|nr:nucleotidyltransferase [Paracoccaceae bacterium]
YSGIQIIKHEICLDNKKKIFSLNEIWDTLIKKEKLYGVLYNGVWADVGTSENIKLAEDIINTKI